MNHYVPIGLAWGFLRETIFFEKSSERGQLRCFLFLCAFHEIWSFWDPELWNWGLKVCICMKNAVWINFLFKTIIIIYKCGFLGSWGFRADILCVNSRSTAVSGHYVQLCSSGVPSTYPCIKNFYFFEEYPLRGEFPWNYSHMFEFRASVYFSFVLKSLVSHLAKPTYWKSECGSLAQGTIPLRQDGLCHNCYGGYAILYFFLLGGWMCGKVVDFCFLWSRCWLYVLFGFIHWIDILGGSSILSYSA